VVLKNPAFAQKENYLIKTEKHLEMFTVQINDMYTSFQYSYLGTQTYKVLAHAHNSFFSQAAQSQTGGSEHQEIKLVWPYEKKVLKVSQN
jgi:hypothetical protein